jgi:6-phosphogluconolactonase (cycloisomerase 2 family)
MLKKRKTNFVNSLVLLLLFCAYQHVNAQATYVFLGSFNWDKAKEGIYVYQLDTKSGQLTKVTSVTGIYNPSYITLSPNGKYLYACTESKTAGAGSVSSFAFDPTSRTLRYLNSQRSGGENPVYLKVHQSGKWLVNGNYTEGSVSVYPLKPNGAIDSMRQNVHYAEGSINKNRQDRSHIHATVFSPQHDHLILPDLGADKIRVYRFDSAGTEPLHVSSPSLIHTTPGSGPRHFTFHPNGKWAYSIEELAGAVTAYRYKHSKLDSFQHIATHAKDVQEGFESSDIHTSPDGRFLYASNRGTENNIAIFKIKRNGRLKPIGYQSTYGNHPRTFAIDPSGRFLLVTNVVSENVVVFKRDSKTGLLKKVEQDIPVTNVSCVQIGQY